MPNEISARTDRALIPAMSIGLGTTVSRLVLYDGQLDPWQYLSNEIIEEAKRVFTKIRTTPPTREALTTWLLPIAAAVRNPPGDDMPAKISAIGQVCGDLPAWVFSLAAQTEAMRQWQWWPAAADVHALLVELSADDLATIAALRRVATTDPPLRYIPAPERPPPTEAEKAAVHEMVAKFVAERTKEAKPVVTGKQLTPAQLDAARRESGLYPHLLGKRQKREQVRLARETQLRAP